MPNKSDIINSVNNLDSFLKVNELKGAKVKKNVNGQPFFFTGGFNMVYQLELQSKRWAFRVWHVNIKNLKERFYKISKYLTEQDLPYFADFIYDEKGLLVNGELVDTIRMEWLEGLLLKEYIDKNKKDKKKLLKLAESFLTMCKELHKNQISHGDLQHGNIIIVKDDKIKLIDYDSICIPDIEGQEEFVNGLKGYQHPSRFNSKNSTSLKVDYFSELIIYLSILAIAENPQLIYKYQVLDSENLLFDSNDFGDLQKSKIYSDLQQLDGQIPRLLLVLEYFLSRSTIDDLEPFYELLNGEKRLVIPKILRFTATKKDVFENEIIKLEWDVSDADLCYLSEVGDVTNLSSLEIKVSRQDYTLIALNTLGKVEKKLAFNITEKPLNIRSILMKAVAVALVCTLFILLYNKYMTTPPSQVSSLNINDLIGYYSAEQTSGNNHQSASAQIININGNLNLRFAIPNYPPQNIPITIDINNLKLQTAYLGAGDIVFHQETHEIEIILKRESNIWVLRK